MRNFTGKRTARSRLARYGMTPGPSRGIFHPVVEVTGAVLAERRSETLRKLAAFVDSPAALTSGPMAALAENSKDIPLALLDIGLPVMDGYELARRLHELPALESLPLLAITGYGQQKDRDRSHAAGFSAHLVKPINLKDVQDLVIALAGARSR